MKTYLRATKQHVKVLFSGHRGSGKSTELRRLAKDVEHEFFVVRVSAADSETVREVLANLSLLEYRNTIAWCDVHPIVRTLL